MPNNYRRITNSLLTHLCLARAEHPARQSIARRFSLGARFRRQPLAPAARPCGLRGLTARRGQAKRGHHAMNADNRRHDDLGKGNCPMGKTPPKTLLTCGASYPRLCWGILAHCHGSRLLRSARRGRDSSRQDPLPATDAARIGMRLELTVSSGVDALPLFSLPRLGGATFGAGLDREPSPSERCLPMHIDRLRPRRKRSDSLRPRSRQELVNVVPTLTPLAGS